MTLCQAIKRAKSYSRNANLHWFVCKWNKEYIIHSSTYMKRFPETECVYSTGRLGQVWDVVYSKDLKRFIHILK